MICTKCNANIPNGKKFCTKCGTPVVNIDEKNPMTSNLYFESDKYRRLQFKSKREIDEKRKEEEAKQREKERAEEERRKRMEEYDRVKSMLSMNIIKCPYCGSSSYTYEKKGFSGGKALAGAALLGPYGLLAGTMGSNNSLKRCNVCGRTY